MVKIFAWIKSHPFWAIGIGLVLIGLLWLWGAKAKNGIESWWFKNREAAIKAEVQKELDAAKEQKEIAAEALKELAEEKKITEQLRKERELAEQLLADRTKTAAEKLRIYQEALRRQPAPAPESESVDDLCRRALLAGISCDPE